MFSLIMAGEAIFGLPFHVSRYFRPTYVEVFGLSQTQLGVLGSIYGFVATFSYILGGGLADRFSPQRTTGFLAGGDGPEWILPGHDSAIYRHVPAIRLLGRFDNFAFLVRVDPSHAGMGRPGTTRHGLWRAGRRKRSARRRLSHARLAALRTVAARWRQHRHPRGQKTIALQSTIMVYTISCFIAAACVWLFIPTTAPPEHAGGSKRQKSGLLDPSPQNAQSLAAGDHHRRGLLHLQGHRLLFAVCSRYLGVVRREIGRVECCSAAGCDPWQLSRQAYWPIV